MPIFLTQSQIDRVIARELPADVYPDGPASAYYWTAERYSTAGALANAYDNLRQIYANMFPQTCDEIAINAWEIKVFGFVDTQGLSLAARQALVIQKLQATFRLTLASMYQVVNFTIPGLTFEIAVWCCGHGSGGWVLDVSQLDVETYLNYDTQFALAVGPNLCSQGPADWGMSQADWDNLKLFAYTYEVRIYTTVLTSTQLALLNQALNTFEPARSNHVINDGLDPSEMINI